MIISSFPPASTRFCTSRKRAKRSREYQLDENMSLSMIFRDSVSSSPRIFSKALGPACSLTWSTASLNAVPLICTMLALPEGSNEQSGSNSTLLRFVAQHGCVALRLTQGKFISCRSRKHGDRNVPAFCRNHHRGSKVVCSYN